jgi:hypothetical protein
MSEIQVPNDEVSIDVQQPASGNASDAFNLLRRFVRRRATAERCDMCCAELSVEHSHLIEPPTRQIVCACEACSILFSGSSDQRYRRIPRRIKFLRDFSLTEAQWDGLMIPIGMAFFFRSSLDQRVIALYPSPAGATESLLDLQAWNEIVIGNQTLSEMELDTEALLINRVNGASDYYLVPIDECFKLVGLIRTKWRGLSGGQDVWNAIEKFFNELKGRSNLVGKTDA